MDLSRIFTDVTGTPSPERRPVQHALAPNLGDAPSLDELVRDPARVWDLPPEAVPALIGELERLRATLWTRLVASRDAHDREALPKDRLLTVEEAAQKLGLSRDYLYRHAKRFPFTVRLGSRLRFSERGVERYIRQRTGA